MEAAVPLSVKHATAWGVLCGAGGRLVLGFGLCCRAARRHRGTFALVIALHRFAWPGLVLLPIGLADGFADLRSIGWRRGASLVLTGGLPLALFSYIGYLFVPLGHGAIIQPACAAVGGMILARLVLKELCRRAAWLARSQSLPVLAIIGAEALGTMGRQGVIGDLLFVAAGSCFCDFRHVCCGFGTFRQCVRWR